MTDLIPAEQVDAILEETPPASESQGHSDVAAASARRARAVRLRIGGATYEQIAQVCGYTDKSSAARSVKRALEEIEAESVGELRRIENLALQRDEVILRGIIDDTSVKAETRIRALDSRLRLSQRRARLNGLDAPIAVALSAGVAADLADALTEAEEVLRDFVAGEVLDVHDDPAERQEA